MAPTISDSKCILVTGATSGIGRALAISLAHLPSKPQVVATGRRQERLDALKTAEGIEGFHMDVDSDSETIQKYVDDLIKAYPEVRQRFLQWPIRTHKNIIDDLADGHDYLERGHTISVPFQRSN